MRRGIIHPSSSPKSSSLRNCHSDKWCPCGGYDGLRYPTVSDPRPFSYADDSSYSFCGKDIFSDTQQLLLPPGLACSNLDVFRGLRCVVQRFQKFMAHILLGRRGTKGYLQFLSCRQQQWMPVHFDKHLQSSMSVASLLGRRNPYSEHGISRSPGRQWNHPFNRNGENRLWLPK